AALPGKDVTDPDEHLRVALSLGHAWEGLWDQDGVHLLAPERLERRAHRLERGDLDVAEVLLDDDGRERITGPLPPLVGDDPDPLTAQDDVVEGGRQPGRADVDLAGGQRGGDGRRRPEKGQLDVHALLLEEALLHSDEDRSLRIPTRTRSAAWTGPPATSRTAANIRTRSTERASFGT